jgi:alcohol dehydrogenase-like protein
LSFYKSWPRKQHTVTTPVKLASQLLNCSGLEKAIGHDDSAITQQDVSNYNEAGVGDPSQTMKALCWMGKNKVEVGSYSHCIERQRSYNVQVEVPKPNILEDGDVILKVTGSTVCGSDLHLLDGSIIQLSKGDILGHEFCGIVDEVGPAVKKVKKGKRYVASFQIACGDVCTPAWTWEICPNE